MMSARLRILLMIGMALPLMAQEAQAPTTNAQSPASVSRLNRQSSTNQAGNFAWRSNLNPQDKSLTVEDFFDGYVGDLVDVARPGYKALPPEAMDTGSEEYADYYKKQGQLIPSPSSFDFAIKGQGFFKVHDDDGNAYYTRNGTFMPNDEGVLINNDGYKLAPEFKIRNPNADYSVNQFGQLLLNIRGEAPRAIYQFELYMPTEAASVSRHNTVFDFSEVVAIEPDKNNQIQNKMLELSTTQAAKTLIRMTKSLYELKIAHPDRNYDLQLYLVDFLLKQYAQAGNDINALERFGQLAESVAPSLVFANEKENKPRDRAQPIMIR
ncbi:MAG: hypothetical protein ACRCVN_01010 [Spirochaetia bacterium]